MVWVETPTNPLLQLADLARHRRDLPRPRHPLRRRQHLRQPVGAAAARARLRHRRALGHQVPQRPLRRDRRHRRRRRRRPAELLRERLGFLQNAVGAIAGPFDSFLALRGVKTLALRMERHCANALELARWLEQQPQVAAGALPGPRLASAARSSRARQMHGFGGMISARARRPTWPARAASSRRCRSSRWPRAWAASRA